MRWEDLAPFINNGVDPPLRFIGAAIARDGVPAEFRKYVMRRLFDADKTSGSVHRPRVKRRGRPPTDRWKLEGQLGAFLQFHADVRGRQRELEEHGADARKTPFTQALQEVGEFWGWRMSAKTFHSHIDKWRKLGVEIPI
jgi:hypothetical protein